MIYVLLDTNIIIDMVVDRRNQIGSNLLNSFVKLLDFGEIKLILPSVVKTETYRHLDSEIEQVGRKIKESISIIKELYGISTYKVPPLDLSEYKARSRAELGRAQTMFEQNENNYKKDIKDTIDLVFNHENTILIDDEPLMIKIEKRRVHKRAPFHKEQKESYGDGAIVETLVNLKRFVPILAGDLVYFVTGNYQDFATSKEKRDVFHPDIEEDLKKAELEVIFAESFGKLIKVYLKQNVENAKLTEELEQELNICRQAEYEELDAAELFRVRESAGLTDLNEFEEKIEYELSTSNFSKNVCVMFRRLNTCYAALEDIGLFFTEICTDTLTCSTAVSCFDGICCDGKDNVDNIVKIKNYIEENRQYEEISGLSLPDTISFGEEYSFVDAKQTHFKLILDSLEHLTIEDGGSDVVDIRILCENQTTVARGLVDVIYGFFEEDEDGNAGNGLAESIEFDTDEIIATLENIVQKWEQVIRDKKEAVDILRTRIGL